MSKKVWKGGALLAPVAPCLVSCSYEQHINLLTVAWTGITCTNPPKTYISVRPERYSYELIKKSGCFVINLPSVGLARAVDFCGVRSGKDTDKFREAKLTYEPSPNLGCPSVCESPVSIECRVSDVIPLGSHDMFLADIVSVSVDERCIDERGKLRLDKAELLAYAHGSYYALGRYIGDFGFSVMKKKTAQKRRMRKK